MKVWMTAIVFVLGTAFGLALVGTFDHAFEVGVSSVATSGWSELNQAPEISPPEPVGTGAVDTK
jgi:hypothetical protein